MQEIIMIKAATSGSRL